jgi:hypothetical protein
MMDEKQARRRALIVVIVAGILFAWLLLAARASAAECATGEITWTEGGPLWSTTTGSEAVNTAINGTFLWIQPDRGNRNADDPDGLIGTTSVELTGSEIAATVCPDGSVTFVVESQPALSPLPVIDDEVVAYEVDPTFRLLHGRF